MSESGSNVLRRKGGELEEEWRRKEEEWRSRLEQGYGRWVVGSPMLEHSEGGALEWIKCVG
ncbi:MAG: hypothetical protein GY820_33105 [Gammaproteobacteria bacterium]|nr:hypothetical protein [Gammaproteobacteria bacterium]